MSCWICPACDVTAWVREGQQYPGPGRGPHTGIYAAPKRFGKKDIRIETYLTHTIMSGKQVHLTLTLL